MYYCQLAHGVSNLLGHKKKVFGQKINCSQMKLLSFVNWHNAKASKSANIVLSKVIFPCQKITEFKKNNLYYQFFIFLTPIFSPKIKTNFCRPTIHKMQQFHLIFDQKPCFLGPIKLEIPWPNWHVSKQYTKRNITYEAYTNVRDVRTEVPILNLIWLLHDLTDMYVSGTLRSLHKSQGRQNGRFYAIYWLKMGGTSTWGIMYDRQTLSLLHTFI